MCPSFTGGKRYLLLLSVEGVCRRMRENYLALRIFAAIMTDLRKEYLAVETASAQVALRVDGFLIRTFACARVFEREPK